MKGAHLTLDDRKIIQRDLENGMNRAQIAKELGKSPSTISKEIKLHGSLTPPSSKNLSKRCKRLIFLSIS